MGSRDDIDSVVSQYRKGDPGDSENEEEYDSVGGKTPFVDWNIFNLFVGMVITANALTIGLETDARSDGKSQDSPVWYLLELLFCSLFMSELALRVFFHGLTYFANPAPRRLPEARREGEGPGPPRAPAWRGSLVSLPGRIKLWNIMDLIIVLISIIDTFILMPMGSGGSARFISMLRFVRLLRLIRLVRLFKIFKELWLVATCLINAMKTLLWVCVMIFILCYIAGIFSTLWVGHNDKMYDPYFRLTGWDHEVYFSTVARSVFTLFQVITLDQWSEGIARHVIKNQPGMLVLFLLLICVVTFGLLNIIVGVVVENALSTAAKDQHRLKKAADRDRSLVFSQLREIFEDADQDGSGTLTFEEVQTAINKPEIYNKLRMIDFPVDDPQYIFELLDYDDSGELTIEEFITGCLRMKGKAKSKDLLVAQVALDVMKKHYSEFEQELDILQGKLKRLDATARAVTEHGERVFLDMRQYRVRHPQEKGGDVPRLATAVMRRAPWELSEAQQKDEEEQEEVVALEPYRALRDLATSAITQDGLLDAEYSLARRPGEAGQPRLVRRGSVAIEDARGPDSPGAAPPQRQLAVRDRQRFAEFAPILDDSPTLDLAVPGSMPG